MNARETLRRSRGPSWWLELTPLARRMVAALTLLGGAAGAGAGWAVKTERSSALPNRMDAVETRVTAVENTISIRSARNDAFRDSIRNSRFQNLPAKVDSLSLQVCLLRVEIRHDANADICAGLR